LFTSAGKEQHQLMKVISEKTELAHKMHLTREEIEIVKGYHVLAHSVFSSH